MHGGQTYTCIHICVNMNMHINWGTISHGSMHDNIRNLTEAPRSQDDKDDAKVKQRKTKKQEAKVMQR